MKNHITPSFLVEKKYILRGDTTEPKDTEKCNVFALLKLVASEAELTEWENKYRNGNMGYGEAKKRLAELMIDYFKPFRQKRAELEKNTDHVKQVLADGAKRAKAVAAKTLARARNAVGLGNCYGK